MAFKLQQSGPMRARGLELSTVDFKERVVTRSGFWWGFLPGFLSGCLLCFVAFGGFVIRLPF